MADGVPRPPSGPGEDEDEDEDAVLPGHCAQLLHPHTTKNLSFSPAGVCLILAFLRESCSHPHLTVPLPGSPELLHSHQIQQRHEQQGHFMELAEFPAALQLQPLVLCCAHSPGGAGGAGRECRGWVTWFSFSRAALASTSPGQFLQLGVSQCWKALPSDLLIVKQHWTLIKKKESSTLQGEMEVNELGKVII